MQKGPLPLFVAINAKNIRVVLHIANYDNSYLSFNHDFLFNFPLIDGI